MELLLIGLFFWIVYSLSRKTQKNTNSNISSSSEIIDINSKNYIQGYLDGFHDHKRNIENTHITQRFSSPNTSGAPATPTYLFPNPRPVMSDAEQKEKHHLQNINTALYMACFLIVVAAALFMGESLSSEIRFVGVWAVTLAFYIAGLVIHKNIPKLKSAAVAFIGTGLALLPFTGFALNYFILPNDPAICWFITSIIGLVGYIFAATYLKSQTIAYFVIAFMVSLSTSSVASLKLALIWYFVALIILGSILTLIASMKPKSLPTYFAEPIEKTNTFIVPLTLAASLFSAGGLVLSDYCMILSVCTVYYLTVAVTETVAARKMYAYFTARLVGTLAALVICYDITDSYVSVGLLMSILAVVQLSISSLFLQAKRAGDVNNETWLWLGFGMQLIASLFVLSDSSWPNLVIAQMSALLISSFSMAYFLRRAELSIFGSIAGIALPLVWGLQLMVPAVEGQWLSMIFAVYVAAVLFARYSLKNLENRPVLSKVVPANFGLFLMFMLLCTTDVPKIWLFVIWLMAALFSYALVAVEKKPLLLALPNILFVASLIPLADLISTEGKWSTVIISWLGLIVFYVAYLALVYVGRVNYAKIFWWSAVVVGWLFGFFGLFNLDVPVATMSGLIIAISSLLIAVRGWTEKKYLLVDVGLILATLGLQRIVGVNVTDLDFLVYTHWWALTFAMLSVLNYQVGRKYDARACTVIGLLFITFFGFTSVLGHMLSGEDAIYSVIFFIEHAIILVYGLVMSAKLQRNWGVVALVLDALWMMKEVTFALPATVAIVLIIFAVRALSKQPSSVQK
jgi:hypothetical protein